MKDIKILVERLRQFSDPEPHAVRLMAADAIEDLLCTLTLQEQANQILCAQLSDALEQLGKGSEQVRIQ